MARRQFRPVPLGGETQTLREVLTKFPASGSAKVSAKNLHPTCPRKPKGAKRDPKESQKGANGRPKRAKGSQKGAKGGKKEPSGDQGEPKGAKGSQKGAKMEPSQKETKRRPKVGQKTPQTH